MAKYESTHKEAWLCLRFTHLALNSLGVQQQAKEEACVISYQDRVWQHNQAAANSAIVDGMTINHALMLHPALILHQRKLVVEEQKIQSLAHWAYRFTATISVYNDHTLLLEIGKSLRLFRGLKQLLNLVSSDLIEFSMDVRTAVAYTPKAALLLTFKINDAAVSLVNSTNQLMLSDIDDLAVSPTTVEQLKECGFECLADVVGAPNADLGNRFGIEFLDYLDKLLGHSPDLQTTVIPPEVFAAHLDFAEPISNVTWIKQQQERLLKDLVAFIQQRQLVCRGFTWRLFDDKNKLLATVNIALSTQHFSDQALLKTMQELTALKFDTLQLTWSFSRIELFSKELVLKQLFNNDLFDPKPDDQAFNQLIDKLVSRLGVNAVFHLVAKIELLPELANVRQLAVDNGAKPKAQATVQASLNPALEFKDQPLWLVNPPKPIPQRSRQPEFEGPLQIIHGPDRIVSHWWSTLQSRDYYIARQTNGRLIWLFLDRAKRQWFLHGLFG